MTRKSAPKAHVLSIISPFITIFAALIALLAPAELTGAGQPSTTATVEPMSQDASPPLFLPAVTHDSGGQLAWSIAVGDFNGDGKPDMAVTNHSGTVGVLLGKGNGSFQPVVAYDSGGFYSHSIVVVDLNKDGKLDLVISDDFCPTVNESCVSVLLGNGDGTFQPAATYDAGGYPYASGPGINIPIFVADVNGDGKPDLVVANATDRNQVGDGVVGVLLGNGDGTFQPVVRYDSGGFGASGAAMADVNGDGKLDVVVVNCGGPVSCAPPVATVGVLLGNGNGTFQAVKTYGTGGWGSFAYPLAVADVNDDGKLDILVGNQCPQNNGNCVGDGTVGILLGNGDGTFQTSVTYDTGSVISIAVADLNGDGKLDLAVANNGTTVLLV
jgi:FG-GAP-like repeat